MQNDKPLRIILQTVPCHKKGVLLSWVGAKTGTSYLLVGTTTSPTSRRGSHGVKKGQVQTLENSA